MPILTQIIQEGIKKGLFKSSYPQEITEILFLGIDRFIHLNYHSLNENKLLSQKVKAIQEIVEKSVGLKSGSLNIIS